MSARTVLLEQLATDLPDVHHVSRNTPDASTKIPTGRTYITVQRARATPANVSKGWGQALTVYVLVGAEDYANAEDALDIHLPDVVAAIEARGYPISTIDRDVFFESDTSDGWHGYRIILTSITSTL